MNILKSVQGNDLIKTKIDSGEPFIATKLGTVEKSIIVSRILNRGYDHIRHMASNNAGITPSDDRNLDFFVGRSIESLKNVDILGFWSEDDSLLYSNFATNAVLSELRFLESFYFESPWSQSLVGKKVLVIHPFEESIKKQYSKRDLLFKNKNILPDFDLLTIRAAQTNGGGTIDSKGFIESYQEMIEKMNNISYDIALIGCGAYGILLANHAKVMGKQAIHIGGGLQILFGIKGKRWDVHPEISLHYNEHWVRPLDNEKTLNIDVVEGGTYW
jgi:hypothetical protein